MFLPGLFKRMKSLLADYTCIFWTFLFPIILIVMFAAIIPNNAKDQFKPVKVLIVGKTKDSEELFRAMKEAKTAMNTRVFDVSFSSSVVAGEKLRCHEIDAYILELINHTIVCNTKDSNTRIVNIFVDCYKQISQGTELKMDMKYVMKSCALKSYQQNNVYFLILIALGAFLAMHWGIRIATDVEANQSGLAAHIMISPIRKWKVTLQNILVVFFLEFTFNTIIVFLIVLLRDIRLLHIFPYIMLIQMLTSLVGVLMGVCFCVLVKVRYELKQKLCEKFAFLLAFLGGIMVYKVKYMIDNNVPVLGKANPVNVASDAMYHVFFYKDLGRYMENVAILFAMAVVLTGIVIYITRREIYERM